MQVHTRGDGIPEIAVVAGIHGDEECGPHAIERFLNEEHDIMRPVAFIVANEAALGEGRRFLDADLNRSFPGDPDSDKQEERLAAELREQVHGCVVLDMHATVSFDEPFAVAARFNDTVRSLIQATGVGRVVDVRPISGNSLIDHCDGVVVECGPLGSEQAKRQAYKVLTNFLAAQGVIDADAVLSNPHVYRVREQVPKKPGTMFTADNFEQVNAGEAYATVGGEDIIAEDTFIPVLMSTDGYTDMLGFAADHLGPLSTLAREVNA